jgi:predicted ester cyclase
MRGLAEDAARVSNKDLARAFLERVLDAKDYGAAGRYLSVDALDHFNGSATAAFALAAFPNYRLQLEHIVGEDDIVTVLATFSGTHTREFMGLPPTGRGVTGRVAFTFRVAEGRIAETWTEIEPWGLLQQLDAPALMHNSRKTT